MDLQTPLSNLSVNTERIQYIAILGSVALLFFIVELTRKGAIRVPYALIWLILSSLFLLISIWRDILEKCAILIGVAYAPAALFLLLLIGIIGILIHFSVVLSTLTERTRILVQQLSILQTELKTREDISSLKSNTSSNTNTSFDYVKNSDNNTRIQ